MGQEEHGTSVNHSEKAFVNDGVRATQAPRFDVKSIQHARPAVPLSQVSPVRRGLLTWVLIALFAGIVGGVAGTLIYRNAEVAQHAGGQSADVEASGDVSEPGADREQSSQGAAAEEGDVPVTTAPDAEVGQVISNSEGAGRGENREPNASEAERPAAMLFDETLERAALREALGGWLAATNSRDIRRQMSFYNPHLEAFYLSRNASARDVQAEKQRVFGSADQIEVAAMLPDIRLSTDGRTATMRFRKRYQIEGGGENRRGEVVQELRWRKTGNGWKIVSERDLRVLND